MNASLKAHFFDQQEELNRTVNALRNEKGLSNVISSTGAQVRKSAELLRSELDKSSELLHLKDKIIEIQSEASVREKEMQNTINKLRVDNKQLASQVGNIPLDLVTSDIAVKNALEKAQVLHFCKKFIFKILFVLYVG